MDAAMKRIHIPKYERHLRETIPFDPREQYAVIRSSICTGEQVIGFQDKNTGKFLEEGLISSPDDLKGFLDKYGLKETEIKRIW